LHRQAVFTVITNFFMLNLILYLTHSIGRVHYQYWVNPALFVCKSNLTCLAFVTFVSVSLFCQLGARSGRLVSHFSSLFVIWNKRCPIRIFYDYEVRLKSQMFILSWKNDILSVLKSGGLIIRDSLKGRRCPTVRVDFKNFYHESRVRRVSASLSIEIRQRRESENPKVERD